MSAASDYAAVKPPVFRNAVGEVIATVDRDGNLVLEKRFQDFPLSPSIAIGLGRWLTETFTDYPQLA